MAVLPVLMGLGVSVAAHKIGFAKSLFGASALGEWLGWVGVVILAFAAGLETRAGSADVKLSKRILGSAVVAIIGPFMIGFGLASSGALEGALQLSRQAPAALSAAAFGLCMAVSALPVLAGIVRELDASERILGNLALRIAALDDAILWCGLSILLLLKANGDNALWANAPQHAAAVLALVTLIIARPAFGKLASRSIIAAITIAAGYLLLGAWATSALGLHEFLGAYLAGYAAPRGVPQAVGPERIGRWSLYALSPLFFAHRGLGVDGSVLTLGAIGVALALFVLGAFAKFLTIQLTPPEKAMSTSEKAQLGALLQCKGLMEIVAASILQQAGLISSAVFAILVSLAVISTVATLPLFRLTSRLAKTPARVLVQH